MIYILENKKLRVSASTNGGELNSVFNKDNNTEYLWDGNPSGWKYHAPILFPIVGKVVNSKYKVNNKSYELPQHGLARISKFNVIYKDDTSIIFELTYSEKTLEVYPFKFKLNCEYMLEDNKIDVKYRVINLDSKNIYFSIGSHPAFMCPREKETIQDYYLEFNKEENVSIKLLTENGYLSREERVYLKNSKVIDLKEDTFKNDALIFNNLQSDEVTLKCRNNNKSVSINFKGFPYLGIWSPTNGANLICIEPWFGHADYYDFNEDFSKKDGIIKLNKDKSFECSYSISIN